MILFPAIDILAGRCVRLRQGRYDSVTVYSENPSEAAMIWEAEGAAWLHVVDLDGARKGRPVNLAAVERIVERVKVPIQYGGGARTELDIKRLINLGVSRVVLGTALVSDPEFTEAAVAAFGQRIVAGIDVRAGKAAIAGWREETNIQAVDLASELEKFGIARIVYTDITVDGTRRGPNLSATRDLAKTVSIPIIASGGVSSMEDIEALKGLEYLGVEGVIIGSALYEKSFKLAEAIEAARG